MTADTAVWELRHGSSQFRSHCFQSVDTLLVAWLNQLLGIYLSFFYFDGLHKHEVTCKDMLNYMPNGFGLGGVFVGIV